MDSINGLSRNRDADFGDEEDDDDEEEEVEAQQASGETVFPDSQELLFTLHLVPSQPTEGRLPYLEGGEGTSGLDQPENLIMNGVLVVCQEDLDMLLGSDLCAEEQDFLQKRKKVVAATLKKVLQLEEDLLDLE
ncbi:unnamed protein product, partial [Natator depressus]